MVNLSFFQCVSMCEAMKKVKYYLFVVMISLIPAALYGNPQKAHYCISDEIQNYMSTLVSLRQIMFEAVNGGKELSEEDFKSVFENRCFIESIKYEKERARILVKYVYRGTHVVLVLESNRIGLYQEGSGLSIWVQREADKRIALYISPEEKQLLKDVYGHFEIFAVYLYELLNRCTQADENANPFKLRMRDAFEQSGYVWTESVKYELPFAINAENAHAFLRKWCTDKKQKGESLVAIQTDMQPLCNVLVDGVRLLCSRVSDLFKTTVIFVRRKNSGFIWTVRCPKDKEERYQILAWQRIKEMRRNVFIVAIDYLAFSFWIKFERNRRLSVKEMSYNGYDNLSVAYEGDMANRE